MRQSGQTHGSGVVHVGSMCSNYHELVHNHPTHLDMCCSCRFDEV